MKTVKKKARAPKSDRMPWFMTLMFWICLLVFLGSGGYLGYRYLVEPAMAEQAFGSFREAYTPTQKGDNLPRNADNTLKAFDELRALNSHVIGWIQVPNTVIDYPVVKFTDNKFYLKHNIEGKADRNGTIFADFSTPLEYGKKTPVTVLYGHHMRSGIMFQNLMKYDVRTQGVDFYKENPVITYNTIYEPGQWVIFGLMKIDSKIAPYLDADKNTENPNYFGFVQTSFTDGDEFGEYIAKLRSRSMIDTDSCIEVTEEDEILLLSTCSYEYSDYRTVVMARKVRDGEKIDVSSAKKAANPVMPAGWNRAI